MSNAGYSGNPLWKKLGIKADSVVRTVNAPPELTLWLDGSPSVDIAPFDGRECNILLTFLPDRATLLEGREAWSKAIYPGGAWWTCWPKKSSGIKTDLLEQDLRDFLLPIGIVDNKVCAVSEQWSGLRFVWRVELR